MRNYINAISISGDEPLFKSISHLGDGTASLSHAMLPLGASHDLGCIFHALFLPLREIPQLGKIWWRCGVPGAGCDCLCC
ncbi:MAG: hypothetical protein KME30_17005 [Iphinoe sp. HA4291-MV1]|jgi:hypothetical protein|nr:hypothetical protein [Iphinoe sp. HA4291-MV1]